MASQRTHVGETRSSPTMACEILIIWAQSHDGLHGLRWNSRWKRTSGRILPEFWECSWGPLPYRPPQNFQVEAASEYRSCPQIPARDWTKRVKQVIENGKGAAWCERRKKEKGRNGLAPGRWGSLSLVRNSLSPVQWHHAPANDCKTPLNFTWGKRRCLKDYGSAFGTIKP